MARTASRWLTLPLACALGLFVVLFGGATRALAGTTRVLLVACENFAQQPGLAPAPSSNVSMLTQVFARTQGPDAQVYTAVNTAPNAVTLSSAIATAFGGAAQDDLSVLYISTHGQYNPETPLLPATLTLSDGVTDEKITGRTIQNMLDPIPGMKLIMLDTCNSGAIVGKGLSPVLHNSLPLPFRRADYMVLTSAGGTELSWAFSDERRERALRLGNSYFAAALAFGLGLQGTYAADIQQDGVITLDEIYQYLLQNHASSTVQVYPQQSDYPVFTYNPKAARTAAPPVISGTVFSDELVTLQNPTVDFSFTVHSAVRLRYQLVYWRSGQWDWAAAQWLRDTYETPQGLPIDQGWVSPGRKQRALELSGVGEQSAGYAMVQIIALRDTGPQVCASKLIALMPLNGDPRMRIEPLPEGFVPLPGTELAVQVSHAFPLRLTARVLDAYGKPVRRLANNQLTHPIPISPEGSLFYWNGCDDAGQLCPPGLYTLDVSARVGDTRYHAQADLQLMAP